MRTDHEGKKSSRRSDSPSDSDHDQKISKAVYPPQLSFWLSVLCCLVVGGSCGDVYSMETMAEDCNLSTTVPSVIEIDIFQISAGVMFWYLLLICGCLCYQCHDTGNETVRSFGTCLIDVFYVWLTVMFGLICHIFAFFNEAYISNGCHSSLNISLIRNWSLAALIFMLFTFVWLCYNAIKAIRNCEWIYIKRTEPPFTLPLKIPDVSNSATVTVHSNTVSYDGSESDGCVENGTIFIEATTAHKKSFLSKLYFVQPSGKTCKLRDAIASSLAQMQSIQHTFGSSSDADNKQPKLVNIILTSSDDNGSTIDYDDLPMVIAASSIAMIEAVGTECLTFIIGIGSDQSRFSEMRALDESNDWISYWQISENEIIDAFGLIAEQLGTVRTDGNTTQTELDRFVVMFSVDCSESMWGIRWAFSIGGLANFLDHLSGDLDWFGLNLFSENVNTVKV